MENYDTQTDYASIYLSIDLLRLNGANIKTIKNRETIIIPVNENNLLVNHNHSSIFLQLCCFKIKNPNNNPINSFKNTHVITQASNNSNKIIGNISEYSKEKYHRKTHGNGSYDDINEYYESPDQSFFY